MKKQINEQVMLVDCIENSILVDFANRVTILGEEYSNEPGEYLLEINEIMEDEYGERYVRSRHLPIFSPKMRFGEIDKLVRQKIGEKEYWLDAKCVENLSEIATFTAFELEHFLS